MTVVGADWDKWVQATGGTFCVPGVSPYQSSSSTVNKLFFKQSTPGWQNWLPGIFGRDESSASGGSFFSELMSDEEHLQWAADQGNLALQASGYGNLTVDQFVDQAEQQYLQMRKRPNLTSKEQQYFDYIRNFQQYALQERVSGPGCSGLTGGGNNENSWGIGVP